MQPDSQNLENLAKMEYPGRFIILGRDQSGENNVVVYGITGRSPASQARKIVQEENRMVVTPTDEEAVAQGDRDLLIYPAMILSPDGSVAVSNGKQTDSIAKCLACRNVVAADLVNALKDWDFEPDEPIYTPRISGMLKIGYNLAGLSIIRRGPEGLPERNYFHIPLMAGRGRLITTYKGDRENVAAFDNLPLAVNLTSSTPEETAQQVYNALSPKDSKPDLRVTVAAAYISRKEGSEGREGSFSLHIINRHNL